MKILILIICLLVSASAHAASSAPSGNGVERGSVNFSDKANAINPGVKDTALDAIFARCRITKRVKDFSLIAMDKTPVSDSSWFPYDTTYNLKFKIIYLDTWHRDWIEIQIVEPYEARVNPKGAFEKPRVKSLESVTGLCD